MEVYKYSELTGEYTGTAEAQPDPLESKKRGEFIPLVPANATLTAPQKCGTNKVQVYENGAWVIKSDYRKNYKQANAELTIEDITTIGELEEGQILVANSLAEDIEANRDMYYVQSGKIMKKTQAELEEEEQEHINNLTMTALDFITFLRQAGLTLEQITAYLSANIELDTQLKYCQNVYCGVVKQLMPITLDGITITSDMVETAFKTKNGVE